MPAVVIDACFAIGYCANEAGKFAKAKAALEGYSKNGWQFYAPGVMISECLFAMCRQVSDGKMTVAEHTIAVNDFIDFMGSVLPSPSGDASLINRAEQIRGTYGCSHSADAIYLALVEELAKSETAEVVTFDDGMDKLATANVPAVKVNLLT